MRVWLALVVLSVSGCTTAPAADEEPGEWRLAIKEHHHDEAHVITFVGEEGSRTFTFEPHAAVYYQSYSEIMVGCAHAWTIHTETDGESGNGVQFTPPCNSVWELTIEDHSNPKLKQTGAGNPLPDN